MRDYGRPIGFDVFHADVRDIYKMPLVNQPGSKWEYGINIDWAGIVLERATGSRLNDLIQKGIIEPLGLKNVTMAPTDEMKKNLASMVGGVSGVFGLVAVPADLLFMTYLQIILLTDVATLYKVNLKSDRARGEMLDLFGYANGLGPLHRVGPKVMGKLAALMLEKGGLHALVKWLAQRGGPDNVLVNGVAPASTETPMIAGQPVDLSRIPLRRRSQPEEIAWPIAFLCSEAASYITGAMLDVNGGVFMS